MILVFLPNYTPIKSQLPCNLGTYNSKNILHYVMSCTSMSIFYCIQV
jgi:hypothetical protein